jgi:biopolymer transport protein ExbB/TolQ
MTDGVASLDSLAHEVVCPHCGGANHASSGAGAILDCVHCDRSFGRPRSALIEATSSLFDPIHARSPTDVGMRVTGTAAAAITVFFYAAVVGPLEGSYFAELFGARGWVPYVIAWLSAWAGVLLSLKAWLLSAQRRALGLDLLPMTLASRITPRNADLFREHLRATAARSLATPSGLGNAVLAATPSAKRSFLVERLDRALERLRMRKNAEDVIDQLASQSQLDANAVESSYTMVRVFIWAIPLLGFIGTVVGISAAVAGFSDSVASAVDLDVMKQSIGTVTTGLGVAFDTTLLALVMSIVIMFPTSLLQKAEEDFLNRVEVYCDEHLCRRLDDGAEAGGGGGLEALQDQIARLASSIETLDTKLRGS